MSVRGHWSKSPEIRFQVEQARSVSICLLAEPRAQGLLSYPGEGAST